MEKAPEVPSKSAAPPTRPASTVSDEARRFFRRTDWIAAGAVALVSFAVYVYTLAPTVTLQDSGEFITASYNLGVPHPPGYPLWTILTWLSTKIPIGNIAWRVNLFSAIVGAITNGLVALLISRSGASFLEVTPPFSKKLTPLTRDRIAQFAGLSGALIFAFSDVMWSQAVITEVYTLNAFFLVILMLLMFIWIHKPRDLRYLYWTAFFFGLGLTNHHTLIVIFPAFAVIVFFMNRQFFLDFVISSLIIIGTMLGEIAYLSSDPDLQDIAMRAGILFAVIIVAIIFYKRGFAWKSVLAMVGAVWLGLAFYFYMPLASSTNPPMNWGYCRVKEGVYHHLTRGQYEAGLAEQIKRYLGPIVFKKPPPPPPQTGTPWTLRKYFSQIDQYFKNLSDNFSIYLVVLALFLFFYFGDLSRKDRAWVSFQLALFFFLVPVLIKLLNPEFDKQTQEIQKVFFILSHAVYAVWIGYGAAFLLSIIVARKPDNPAVLYASCGCAALLPLIPMTRNWADCEQRGHQFGYYFGHDMFETNPKLEPLYPSMERGAILYGGTDPGRFVPTFMILVESLAPKRAKYHLDPDFDRRDVYIITQNALADNTYMNYIRDHYAYERPNINDPLTLTNRSGWQKWMFKFGWNVLDRKNTYPKEPIWIPNVKEVEAGFTQYVNELKTRPAQPGENVRIEGGKVQIQGVQGVMAINGIISKMIFDKNKDKHAFYVEESYVINWMYPYLEPFKNIMKINREPMARLDAEKVERDRRFWDAYVKMLLDDPNFSRDSDAQKSFSKLRTAIAGLYAWRGANGQPELNAEAEYAFKQALTLCPDSPETNFRYVELLSRLERFDDALDVLENFRKLDPYNAQILRVIENVKGMQRNIQELRQWEERYRRDPSNLDVNLKLVQYYASRRSMAQLDQVVNNLIHLPTATSNHIIEMAKVYAQLQRFDRIAVVLETLTRRFPDLPAAWYDLAVVNSLLQKPEPALNALSEAVKRGGDQFRNQAKQDRRLGAISNLARFKEIVGE